MSHQRILSYYHLMSDTLPLLDTMPTIIGPTVTSRRVATNLVRFGQMSEFNLTHFPKKNRYLTRI